jgi:hypothetical protein
VVYSLQPGFHFNCLPFCRASSQSSKRPFPLSLYRLTKEVSSGSVVVNDCLFQFANLYAPFGGVGESGMGGYHGRSFFAGGVVCVVLLRGLRALFTAVFLRRCTCISVSMKNVPCAVAITFTDALACACRLLLFHLLLAPAPHPAQRRPRHLGRAFQV